MKEFRQIITNTYKNPVSRKLAVGRKLAFNRKIATNRKVIGFIDDGKPHVVLDTNIIIYSVYKEKEAVHYDCLKIMNLWKEGFFSLGINSILLEEYKKTGDALIRKSIIDFLEFNNLFLLISEKAYSHRSLVDKQHVASSYKDDHLFDGFINPEYLVSEDKKDVSCTKVKNSQTIFKKILTASEFIQELEK